MSSDTEELPPNTEGTVEASLRSFSGWSRLELEALLNRHRDHLAPAARQAIEQLLSRGQK